MNDKQQLLEIEDLAVRYVTEDGTVRALEHLDLSLGYGETLGFVGETGAGKTTAALAIMQLIPHPPGKSSVGKSCLKDRICSASRVMKCGISAAKK